MHEPLLEQAPPKALPVQFPRLNGMRKKALYARLRSRLLEASKRLAKRFPDAEFRVQGLALRAWWVKGVHNHTRATFRIGMAGEGDLRVVDVIWPPRPKTDPLSGDGQLAKQRQEAVCAEIWHLPHRGP